MNLIIDTSKTVLNKLSVKKISEEFRIDSSFHLIIKNLNEYLKTNNIEEVEKILKFLGQYFFSIPDGVKREFLEMLVPIFIKILDSDNEDLVLEVCCVLGEIGTEVKEIVPKLEYKLDKFFKNLESNIFYYTAWALSRISPNNEKLKNGIERLLKALEETNNKYVLFTIAEVLGNIGAESEKIIPILKDALYSKSNDAKRTAIETLGKIGLKAKEVIEPLIQIFDTTTENRERVIHALGKIGGPAYLYLIELSRESRKTMMQSLNKMTEDNFGTDICLMNWIYLKEKDECEKIRSWLIDKKFAVSTQNRILSAIRGTLKKCYEMNQMNKEEHERTLSFFKSLKNEKFIKNKIIRKKELKEIFENCKEDTLQGKRDLAILILAFGNGLRNSELIHLKVSDYDIETGKLQIFDETKNKKRVCYIINKAKQILDDWVKLLENKEGVFFPRIKKGGKIEPLQKLSSKGIYFILKKRSKNSSHDSRRTFITTLFKQGAEIYDIQKLSGHSNISITSRYRPAYKKIKKLEIDLPL